MDDRPLYAAAQGDLAKILNYLDERSPRGALSVKLAIKRTIDTIGQNPDIGLPATRGAIPACRLVDILISFSGRLRRAKCGCFIFALGRGGSGAGETLVTESPSLCQGLNFRVQIGAAVAQAPGRTGTTSFGKARTP
jgi:plasmid stabilization system protein ParE